FCYTPTLLAVTDTLSLHDALPIYVRPRAEHPVLYGLHRPVLLPVRLRPGPGGRQWRGQSPGLCGVAGGGAGGGRVPGQRPAGRHRGPGRGTVFEISASRSALRTIPPSRLDALASGRDFFAPAKQAHPPPLPHSLGRG